MTTARVDGAVAEMRGAAAPPRRNGELVFEAPWQGRAFGMAINVVKQLDLSWTVFQERLIAAIAAQPDRPYYESWVAALEALLLDHGIVRPAELEAARQTVRADESA